jgi:hypothetical protein
MRHMEERRELSRNVYGLDNEILEHLFKLRSWEKESLFRHYETEYGESGGRYARRTWDEWQNQKRGVSGQVATRFIALAPKVLRHEARYDIVSKMYQKTKRRETHSLTAILGFKEGAFREIEDLFQRLCQKPFEHRWPDSLTKFASWICDEDAEAAKKIIAAIESEHSLLIVKAARVECNRLIQALTNLDSSFAGSHTIELPYGTICLHIRKPNLFEKIKKLLT